MPTDPVLYASLLWSYWERQALADSAKRHAATRGAECWQQPFTAQERQHAAAIVEHYNGKA